MEGRDERTGPVDAGATGEGGGYGRLWARAMERRRRARRERLEGEREERERSLRAFRYRETGGGYVGYGGTADREPWAPEEGRFGGGYSGYGGRSHPRGGGPYPGERWGPRIYRGASRGLSIEDAGERDEERLRAERIGPGAYRRGRPWYGGPGGPGGRGDLH
jgi:hypothetical protein